MSTALLFCLFWQFSSKDEKVEFKNFCVLIDKKNYLTIKLCLIIEYHYLLYDPTPFPIII